MCVGLHSAQQLQPRQLRHALRLGHGPNPRQPSHALKVLRQHLLKNRRQNLKATSQDPITQRPHPQVQLTDPAIRGQVTGIGLHVPGSVRPKLQILTLK